MTVAAERDDWAGLLDDTDEGAGAAAFFGDAPRRDEPLLAPKQLLAGRFSIVRLLAKGALGVVYEALDLERDAPVALKTVDRRLAVDSAAMDRLRSELLLARRVRHPGVCRVFEIYALRAPNGEPLHFLTRELIPGSSLGEHIRRTGPLSTPESLPLVQEMAEALSVAHGVGLVHRDFKPSNVILVPRGQISRGARLVVNDFGVARALLPDRRRSDPFPALAEEMLGSLDHLAPEQLGGGTVTPATDVYALGVVMHQMVTGRVPSQHPLGPLADAPVVPPVALVPELDPRWNAAILRCLERTPERRFPDARAVAAALS
ncbi:MAG TPA: serine/threonine-protein kinase [Myxococcaceae bacterium]|nr:serine/threonine-protein kinase [Myxococcaceae bacterium]